MYAGFQYAGGMYAGTNLFQFPRGRRGGIGGGGFDKIYDLLTTEVDRRRRRRREQILAMREDEDDMMNV